MTTTITTPSARRGAKTREICAFCGLPQCGVDVLTRHPETGAACCRVCGAMIIQIRMHEFEQSLHK